MGVTIREKPPGSGQWWVFVNHNGQRKAKKVGDKRAAKEIAAKIQLRLAAGTFEVEKKPVPTFGELAKEWTQVVLPVKCKPSTREDYEGILKHHVLPVFGKRPVDSITRKEVKVFLLKLSKNRSVSKAYHTKSVISGVLRLAVEDEILAHNPALEIGSLGKPNRVMDDMEPFTSKEVDLLLEVFAKRWPRYYPLVLFLARTGARIGEAAALEWQDINFVTREVHIRRAWSRGRTHTPKSGKARKVAMSPQLARVLFDLLPESKREALAKGWGEVPALVFTNSTGGVVDMNNFRNNVWDRALTVAGLARRRVHDLRHHYASQRIALGHSLADVSRSLGHHSVAFTLSVYTHALPGEAQGQVDELDGPEYLPMDSAVASSSLQLSATQAQPSQKERDLAEAKSLNSLGGLRVDRTLNLRIKSPLLCQLS